MTEKTNVQTNKKQSKSSRLKAVQGIFQGTSRGFGFVTVEGIEEDIFIPAQETNGAMHEDTVEVQLLADSRKMRGSHGKKRTEGIVTRVLVHAHKELVGTYERNKKFGFVIPDHTKIATDIFVPVEDSMGARNGHKVLVEIVEYGTKKRSPQGRVKEIIGHINDPGSDIACIVKAYQLPEQFPKEVLRETAKIPEEVLTEEISGRKDFRSLLTITIDGEDAKDLDDAITIEQTVQGYRLGVHIADVSHYVTEHSLLDKEARTRGTSVYLVNRVIPMLPHALSNGICSLNAGCDRLTLSVLMDIDDKGNVIGHEIAEGVIRVDERMNYSDVKRLVEGTDEELAKRYAHLQKMLEDMKQLAEILRNKRKKRGFVDFDFPETKMVLDEKGRPLELKPYERNVATNMIEEFMLAANETVAEDFFWQDAPFLYRTHETPDPEKLKRLETLIANFGYYVKTGQETIHPKEMQKLLDKIDGTPEETLISRIVLRTMKQARYTTECLGHFGLATRYYCHFTSPIRRYPDLQIHRIIKETLHGKRNDRRNAHYQRILPAVAMESSSLERRADEAERECLKMKKVEYMQSRIGQVYTGIISGMSTWGMYVELQNTVEGLIRIQSMSDDFYYFDEERFEMIGGETNRCFRLGQPVRVRVLECDRMQRLILFELYEEEEEQQTWAEIVSS